MIETRETLQPISTYQPVERSHIREEPTIKGHSTHDHHINNWESYINAIAETLNTSVLNTISTVKEMDIMGTYLNRKVAQELRREFYNQDTDKDEKILLDTITNATERNAGIDTSYSLKGQAEHSDLEIVKEQLADIDCPEKLATTFAMFIRNAQDPQLRTYCMQNGITKVNEANQNHIMKVMQKHALAKNVSVKSVEMYAPTDKEGNQKADRSVYKKDFIEYFFITDKTVANELEKAMINPKDPYSQPLYRKHYSSYTKQNKCIKGSRYISDDGVVHQLPSSITNQAIELGLKIASMVPINSNEAFIRCTNNHAEHQIRNAIDTYREDGDKTALLRAINSQINTVSLQSTQIDENLVVHNILVPIESNPIGVSPFTAEEDPSIIEVRQFIEKVLHNEEKALNDDKNKKKIDKTVPIVQSRYYHTDGSKGIREFTNAITKEKQHLLDICNSSSKNEYIKAIEQVLPIEKVEIAKGIIDKMYQTCTKDLSTYINELDISKLTKETYDRATHGTHDKGSQRRIRNVYSTFNITPVEMIKDPLQLDHTPLAAYEEQVMLNNNKLNRSHDQEVNIQNYKLALMAAYNQHLQNRLGRTYIHNQYLRNRLGHINNIQELTNNTTDTI